MSGATPRDDRDDILVGISSCLLGEEVRFDSSHKLDRFISETLGQFFRFVPVCPEMEIGLGTPRETLRLVRDQGEVRLVGVRSGTDHSKSMREYATRRVRELARQELSGYLLKRASPSCGMERVRLYDENGSPHRVGVGLFAEELLRTLPLLPVEEEGRLHDPKIRENFLDRVFGYHRLQRLFQSETPWTLGDLVAFHTREKYLLLAHETEGYRELGRLVASASERPRDEVAHEYRARYMQTLAVHATTAKHVNVLQHLIGYVRDLVEDDTRHELHASIEDYRNGFVPLIVPITLIRHFVRVHRVEYLLGQHYLEPHPKELMVRNHV